LNTKARLPWLVLALLGGFISVKVLGLFEGAMLQHGIYSLYTIDCGNGRKCWSAIFGNYCARFGNTADLFLIDWLKKCISLLNGLILATILFWRSFSSECRIECYCYCSIDVSIIASLIGTFVPLLLDKFGIDPALYWIYYYYNDI
jgi:magnesium transporter